MLSIEEGEGVSPGNVGMAGEETEGIAGDVRRRWNGYVRYEESWVRRAGLKRELETDEGEGNGVLGKEKKRCRVDG